MQQNAPWFWAVIALILIAVFISAAIVLYLKNEKTRRTLDSIKMAKWSRPDDPQPRTNKVSEIL